MAESSVVNILLRFWDYEQGRATICGIDLCKLALTDVHDILGIMTQRTHLFSTTILENIRITKKLASDDGVIETAKLAEAHNFVSLFPNSCNTF